MGKLTVLPHQRGVLDQARAILGIRARISRDGRHCVVARHEQLDTGLGYEREFGRGPTWAAALDAARVAYAALRKK